MKRFLLSLSLLHFCLCFFSNTSFGQCTPSGLASAACSGGNGAAGNGQNINGGQTYWYSGSSTTFGSGVNLNGGTLRVCGTLILSSININSGNIIVESGGSLTMNGGGLNINGNTNITNYGTLTINQDVTMQNSSNNFVNASTGTLNMSGRKLELNSSSSRFVNNGTANIGTLKIQSNNGGVCLGNNSRIALTTLDNNGANAVTFGSGSTGGCISISGNAQMNPALTNNSKVIICRANGSTTSGAGNFGSATVYTNCTSCNGVLLPITWLTFAGVSDKNGNQLTWRAQVSETAYFEVERSEDALNFTSISPQLEVSVDFKGVENFTWLDTSPSLSEVYYRIKQVDKDGAYSFSKILSIQKNELLEPIIKIYPNPSSDFLQVESSEVIKQYRIIDMLGKEYVHNELFSQKLSLDLSNLPNGTFFIVLTTGQKTWQKLFIKKSVF